MKNQDIVDYGQMYIDWLKQNIDQYRINDKTYRLSFPFLDKDNDFSEIYIILNSDGSYTLTDDGMTLGNLDLSGFGTNSTPRRKEILNSIVSSMGITKEGNELTARCSLEDLPSKKHMLLQCMAKVSDMFYLSKANVQSVFIEDVRSFLDVNKIRYTKDVNFIGKSKFYTNYDFVISHSTTSPDRMIKVVNNLNTDAAKSIIFSWGDIKSNRDDDSVLYTFIQDTEKQPNKDALIALDSYNINAIPWSKKDDYITILSA